MRRIALIIIFLLIKFRLGAQETPSAAPLDTMDFFNMSLEDLAKMKSRYAATDIEKTINLAIEAASRKPLPMRKSPSIISVISGDEIEKSGAKDLMDVFVLIPGLEFNVDVEGVVALSFRGLWSNEGNISLQIDGQEVNEIAYASLQFGNHYQLSQIKKIEVIRGPGSALYGGYAEYAVINIVTKKGEDIKGITGEALLSYTAETYSRQNVSITAGNATKDFSYALSGMIGRGQRSNRTYTDAYNNSYDMKGNSNLNNAYFNMSLAYKNFSLDFIYDDYKTTNRDASIAILSKAYPLDFLSVMTRVKYAKQFNKAFGFTAKFDHKYSNPWTFRGEPEAVDSLYYSYLLKTNRYKASATILWDPTYWLNVNAGAETFIDHAYLTGGELFRTDSTNRVSYFNYAPYIQLLVKTEFANITAGARYDISTAFGSAFNPRLGITKRLGMFNFKLLYASSFRIPAIENIQFAIDGKKLKPESSNTWEAEVSAQLTKNMYVAVNLFDISTTNAIRYFVKTDSVFTGYQDGYRNSDRVIGSQGLELEYKYSKAWGFIKIAYSYYTVRNKDVDPANAVPGNNTATLGTAQNKITLAGSFNIGKHLYLSPSMNFLGNRYAYSAADTSDVGILTMYKPQIVSNFFVGSNSLIKNCSIGVGVSNIFDESILYLQAYNSLHAPLPGMGREYYVRFRYTLPFKKIKE
jgi:outer membrane cobalamin receptor